MNIKTQRHLSRLIFRYLRDRLNEEESRELERWRAASEAHELLFRRLLSSAHWQRSIGRFVKNESDTQSEWEIIRQRTVGRDRGKRTIRWYRYAAAIFLPLLIASGYFIKLSRTPQEKTLVSVPFIPGKSYAVLELADGTSIDLGETAVRGQIQGGHWEVRSDSLKYCEEGVKGGEEYHTLKVPRGGEYFGFSRWLEGVFECRIQLEISCTFFGRSAQSEIGRRSLFRGKTKSGETVCRRYRRYAGQRVGHYFRYQGLCR